MKNQTPHITADRIDRKKKITTTRETKRFDILYKRIKNNNKN